MKKRVVVTGLGLITPLGNNVQTTWENLINGHSGIDYIKKWGDLDEFKKKFSLKPNFPVIAGEVKGDIKTIVRERWADDSAVKMNANYMDSVTLYAMASAHEAIKNSKLDLKNEDLTRCGIFVGTGLCGASSFEQGYERILKGKRMAPLQLLRIIPNMISANLSLATNMKGTNLCITTACATGTHTIGNSYEKISAGKQDVILCGGTEAVIVPTIMTSFHSMKALNADYENPQKASCPFSINHNGFVMSEGAGIVILEEMEHALKRDAPILAEVIGYSENSDSHDYTNPSFEGVVNCIKLAIDDAGIEPDDIDLINSHGTSTIAGDANEANAFKAVCKDHKPYITANKSQLGHSLGAAGAIEAVISIMSIVNGSNNNIPPILNLNEIEPDCEGLNYVCETAQSAEIHTVLSNSYGFGGTNGSLIFKRFAK